MPGVDGLGVAYRRLRTQHLTGPGLPDPVAVVRALGAVQAQEYAVAQWSVGQRTRGADAATVQEALDSGAILRLHALRPTWHFVAAADLPLVLRVTSPRVHQLNAYYYRQHGLDAETDRVAYRLLTSALRGGNHLTRTELAAALAQGGFEATGNRLAYVLMRAELDGVLASGAQRGRQQTYALVSERIPGSVAEHGDPDADLAEWTRRYFSGHGPATAKDFAWWSSLTLGAVRRGLAAAELSRVEVDGQELWYAPGDDPEPPASPAAHVLQGYDEYLVAYTESRGLATWPGGSYRPSTTSPWSTRSCWTASSSACGGARSAAPGSPRAPLSSSR
jgi:hypothetical protein